MSYQTCPVCEGRQTVPVGFYRESTAAAPEPCRTCSGSGVLLLPDGGRVEVPTYIPVPYPAWPPPGRVDPTWPWEPWITYGSSTAVSAGGAGQEYTAGRLCLPFNGGGADA